MKAEIIKDYPNSRTMTRVGEIVEIIRKSTDARVWIKLSNGQEVTWLKKYLKVLEVQK